MKYGTVKGSEYLLPFPQIIVEICNPFDQARKIQVLAMLDTGASRTCIPSWAIVQIAQNTPLIGLSRKRIRMSSPTGNSQSLPLCELSLKLHKCEFDLFEVVVFWSSDIALIGRDLLNRYRIMLDGPAETWDVEAAC